MKKFNGTCLIIFMLSINLFSPYGHGSLRILKATRLCRKDCVQSLPRQNSWTPTGTKQMLTTRHPCRGFEMLKLLLVYTCFPLFSSLKTPFIKTMGTVWPSSEWAGLTRPLAVSWGSLVCSGVDVYISGRTHCFDKARVAHIH